MTKMLSKMIQTAILVNNGLIPGNWILAFARPKWHLKWSDFTGKSILAVSGDRAILVHLESANRTLVIPENIEFLRSRGQSTLVAPGLVFRIWLIFARFAKVLLTFGESQHKIGSEFSAHLLIRRCCFIFKSVRERTPDPNSFEGPCTVFECLCSISC